MRDLHSVFPLVVRDRTPLGARLSTASSGAAPGCAAYSRRGHSDNSSAELVRQVRADAGRCGVAKPNPLRERAVYDAMVGNPKLAERLRLAEKISQQR
jgi:hypothetical protein